MIFNHWPFPTAHLPSGSNSYLQSRTITSWNAIDKEQREPLTRIILVEESTVIDTGRSLDGAPDLSAQTALPLIIGDSFVSPQTQRLNIDTSRQVIKEVNGMANLIVTRPCLTEATSFTHNDSNLTAAFLFYNLISRFNRP